MVTSILAKSFRAGGCGHLEVLLNTGESPQLVLAVSRNCRLISPKLECCLLWSYLITAKSGLAPRAVGLKLCCISFQNMHPKRRCTAIERNPASTPVSIQLPKARLPMLYYNQAQSSLHPKRSTSSANFVLQSSTIQPAV